MNEINTTFNLNNFIRASQYFATVPASSNFYSETIRMLERFFASDLVCFIQKNEVLEVTEHSQKCDIYLNDFLTQSGKFIDDVLNSGFLITEKISFNESGELNFIFLPINIFNQTKSVLSIGYMSDLDVSKETLNILLAISTLLGTFLEKQSTEKSFETLLKEHKTILSTAGEGIMGIDANSRHTFVNPMAANILGYTIDEMIGHASHKLWHYKHIDGSVFQSEDCKIHLALNQGIRYSSSDEVFVRKDGTSFPAEVVVTPIMEEGKVTGGVIVFKDITERKRIEASLRESQLKYADLYDNSPDMYVSIDVKSGVIEQCNQTLCDKLGYTKDEIIGEPIEKLYAQDYVKKYNKVFKKFLKSGEIHDCELQLKSKDETKIDVILNASSERDSNGHILYSRFVWVDISALKKAENALQKAHDELEEKVKERTVELEVVNKKLKQLDQLKSMFIASMSHELRTPLNSIIGFTGVILDGMDGAITEIQRNHLKRVKNAGTHLLGLITDVIDISKIEAGRVESIKEEFMLDEMLEEALQEIELLAKNKNLILKKEIQRGIKMYLDRRRLFQSVLNYLSNAVKYSEQGIITLRAEQKNDTVIISVTDTGIGIAKENQPKLFEAFERMESHLKVKAGGTGLGLYLTKKIIEDILGGEVFFTSELHKGSTFGMVIPLSISLI